MNKIEVVKKLDLQKEQWVHKGFNGTLFYHYPLWHIGMKKCQEYFGFSHTVDIDVFEKETADWYWNYSDCVRVREAFIEKVNKNPKYLGRLVKDWQKRVEKFLKYLHTLRSGNLSKFSHEEFYKAMQKFDDLYIDEFSIAIAVQDPFSMTSDEFLTPHLSEVLAKKKFVPNKIQTAIEILTSASLISFSSQEKIDLCQWVLTCKDVGHLSKAEKKKLENHAKKYYWLNNNYAHTFELGAEHFFAEAKKISKASAKKTILALQKKTKATQIQRQKLFKQLKLGSYTQNLLDIVQTFAYMQDERKKVMLMAVGMQSVFVKEVSKRLLISEDDGKFLTWEEFPQLLKLPKAKLRMLIRDRRSFTLMVAHYKYGPMIFEGKQAKIFHGKIFKKTKSFVTELKGMSACRGTVQGKVVVIKTRKDFGKMQKGCVLVATMTRPEFVPLMQKALAIITDEGGITSHAAIVSRELGIPCIIGTKIATKVFKDGDLVEIDANKGVVRKIK